jgi:hypothetical protein
MVMMKMLFLWSKMWLLVCRSYDSKGRVGGDCAVALHCAAEIEVAARLDRQTIESVVVKDFG